MLGFKLPKWKTNCGLDPYKCLRYHLSLSFRGVRQSFNYLWPKLGRLLHFFWHLGIRVSEAGEVNVTSFCPRDIFVIQGIVLKNWCYTNQFQGSIASWYRAWASVFRWNRSKIFDQRERVENPISQPDIYIAAQVASTDTLIAVKMQKDFEKNFPYYSPNWIIKGSFKSTYNSFCQGVQ